MPIEGKMIAHSRNASMASITGWVRNLFTMRIDVGGVLRPRYFFLIISTTISGVSREKMNVITYTGCDAADEDAFRKFRAWIPHSRPTEGG